MSEHKQALLKVSIIEITISKDGARARYRQNQAEANRDRAKPPSVDAKGNVTVYEDTHVVFELDVPGFRFPDGGQAVIRFEQDKGKSRWRELAPGESCGTFSVGRDQPSNKNTRLEVDDNNADCTEEGVIHPYNLYVVARETYTLDPTFTNRR